MLGYIQGGNVASVPARVGEKAEAAFKPRISRDYPERIISPIRIAFFKIIFFKKNHKNEKQTSRFLEGNGCNLREHAKAHIP